MPELILILIAAASRLIPHDPNFTAVSAVAIYGAVKIKDKRLALLIPLAAMFLTDLVIGLHGGMWYVYTAFLVVSAIGFWIRSRLGFGRLVLGTLAASLSFFVITNFGVWLGGWYGSTAEGLAACYIAAIPFFRNQVSGDLFFTTLIFGADFLISRLINRIKSRDIVKVQA